MLGILTPRRSLPLIAVAAAGWWLASRPTPVTTVTTTPAPALHVVPLSGDPLAEAIAVGGPGGCLEFVDHLVTQPHWRLGVVDASSGCLGQTQHASYDIDADGTVWWTQNGLTRNLRLTDAELATVRNLNRLACARTEEVGYGEAFFQVSYGDASLGGGGHIPGSSAMGQAIRGVLDGAVDRTAAQRLEALGAIRLDLAARSWERDDRWTPRTARYHLTVDGANLTVRRGRRVLHRRPLSPREQIDLVDWAYQMAVEGADRVDGWNLARGQLRLGDRDPIAVTLFPLERGPAELLGRALDEATYRAEHADD